MNTKETNLNLSMDELNYKMDYDRYDVYMVDDFLEAVTKDEVYKAIFTGNVVGLAAHDFENSEVFLLAFRGEDFFESSYAKFNLLPTLFKLVLEIDRGDSPYPGATAIQAELDEFISFFRSYPELLQSSPMALFTTIFKEIDESATCGCEVDSKNYCFLALALLDIFYGANQAE